MGGFVIKTKIYSDALNDERLFPKGEYKLRDIYRIIFSNVEIPTEHLNDRPTCKFPLWKNYIHSVRPNISRIEYRKNQTYYFH